MSEPKRRRSRNGCFTCKIRKVRCNNADQTSILARSANKPCNNCERLGLECRWSAPAAGEQYTRPPKRRRQTAQRRSPPSVVIDHPESIPNGAAGLSSSGTGYHAIDAPQAASAEGVQFSPQLDFSDPVLAAHLNDWEMDLALESLDFMLPDAHYSMTSDPAYVNLPSNKQAPGYDTSSLEATWNLESLSNGRFSRLSASITDENSHLIQHYLHALQGYAKVSDHPRDPNLFLSAFSASLSFQPLFYAILAFSSAHLAMNDPSFTDQAEMYDRMSAECFETFRLAPHISVEGLLCAIFVRIKKIHITGSSTDRFLNLMQIAADILSSDQGHEYLNSRSSAFGRRIITRLAVLDARSAAYRLGGGQFVRRVRDLPSLSDMFSTIVRIDPAAEGIMCLFQVSRLRMQVAELELRIHEQLSAETISAPPVRLEEVTSLYVSLEAHIRAWEVSMKDGIDFDHVASLPDEITLDAVSYRDYTVLSALHSTKLYLHLVFPLSNYPTSHSVSAILHCELMIQKDTSRANSPAALMPASLFLAGVFATDLVHRDWVLSHLKQGERWGTYIRKVGDLLKGIVRTRLQGLPVDIYGAMESTTGPFVI